MEVARGAIELTVLAGKLAQMLAHMGPRSQWALRTSLDAAETEGVAGYLVLRIPPKSKDHFDCSFTVGEVNLIRQWSDAT